MREMARMEGNNVTERDDRRLEAAEAPLISWAHPKCRRLRRGTAQPQLRHAALERARLHPEQLRRAAAPADAPAGGLEDGPI